jgi:ssDNA-binding Zn-finger/Zn-ribbon topoisomerase 1
MQGAALIPQPPPEKALRKPVIECPKCHYANVYRMQRKGFLQTSVYPLFGYFPWECGKCRKTYMLPARDPGASLHNLRTRSRAKPGSAGKPAFR